MKILTTSFSAAILFATIFSAAPAAYALEGSDGHVAPSHEQFQKIKSQILSLQQKREAILKQSESCIQSTSDIAGMKSCRDQSRRANEDLKNQIEAEHGKMGGD